MKPIGVLLLLIAFSLAQEYNIPQHLSTKSPYWNNITNTPPPAQCSLVHVNLVARHGSREPTSGDINKFITFQSSLDTWENYIANSSYFWLRNWTNPYYPTQQGELDDNGMWEHFNLGQRFADRYSTLFATPYSPPVFPIQTTQVSRTAVSGNSFAYGAFQNSGVLFGYNPMYMYSESEDQDYNLRFFDNCPTYSSVSGEDSTTYQSDTWLDTYLPVTTSKVQVILGVDPAVYNISTTDVKTMYTLCAFDISVYNTTTDFCSLFDEWDFNMFEYYEDLSNYYKKGYGIAVNYEIATTLLNDFFNVMESVMAANTSEIATLRFAHAETVMPFVSLLGLFNDSNPLLWNSSQETIDNRQWRTSEVSPFAANVVFELYNCTGDFKVKLLHNEKEFNFPGCDDLYCSFNTLQTLYTKKLGYNFYTLCGVSSTACSSDGSSKDNVEPGVVAATAVGTFLVGAVVSSATTWMVTKKREKPYKYTLMS